MGVDAPGKRCVADGWLFVVVGFALEDGEGAVELFHKDEAYHLVVEGHGREGYLVVCQAVYFRCKAEGSANYKYQCPHTGVHLFLNVLGKAHRCGALAVFVEQDDSVGTLQAFLQQCCLALLNQLGCGALLVFQSGDYLYLEVDVMFQSVDVGVDAFLQVGGVGFGYY